MACPTGARSTGNRFSHWKWLERRCLFERASLGTWSCAIHGAAPSGALKCVQFCTRQSCLVSTRQIRQERIWIAGGCTKCEGHGRPSSKYLAARAREPEPAFKNQLARRVNLLMSSLYVMQRRRGESICHLFRRRHDDSLLRSSNNVSNIRRCIRYRCARTDNRPVPYLRIGRNSSQAGAGPDGQTVGYVPGIRPSDRPGNRSCRYRRTSKQRQG